jgi:hypothetical protein
LQAAGYDAELFQGEYYSKNFLPYWGDTQEAARIIDIRAREVFSETPRRCWCVLGYSWGGGQAERLAFEVAWHWPAAPLHLAVTVEAIQVRPAPNDTTSSAVTERLEGALWHLNYWAGNSWVLWWIRGGPIPRANVDDEVKGVSHLTIQNVQWLEGVIVANAEITCVLEPPPAPMRVRGVR